MAQSSQHLCEFQNSMQGHEHPCRCNAFPGPSSKKWHPAAALPCMLDHPNIGEDLLEWFEGDSTCVRTTTPLGIPKLPLNWAELD